MKLILTFLLIVVFLAPAFAYDYQKIDEHAKQAPDKAAKTVETLTAYLVKPARNDQEKVRSFYTWLAFHIAYDVQVYRAFDPFAISKTTSADVLQKRKAVCQGYSELFKEMCELAGIKSYLIPGYSKGFGYEPGKKSFAAADHAWNAVWLEGRWHLLDATWGSGGVNNQMKYVQQFNEKYFLADPKVFVKDHLPLEPAWQLLDCPVSMKAFVEGEEAIDRSLAQKRNDCKDHNKVIKTWEGLPEHEKMLQSASEAYAFNPNNHAAMARGYMDYANYIMRGIKSEMHSRQEIEEAVVAQQQALDYLKKADTLLKNVKDNSADMEKQILKKNIQLSEQNLKSMQKVLKG